jgi:hypothetical protein
MAIELTVERDERLPKLAWYAKFEDSKCHVSVGRFVEVDPASKPRWVVAGMWAGPFAKGGFHTAEHVFGSGLRLDDGVLHVVPAHSTVDRCVYARDGATWHLSNSLVVLLGKTGARPHMGFDHRPWAESMCLGINHYIKSMSVEHPRIPQVSQLIWEKLRIKPDGSYSYGITDKVHDFADYQQYHQAYRDAVAALWANATDKARAKPMRAVTSASRGYDSASVASVVVPITGPITSWTAKRSNTRIPQVLRGLMKTDVADDDGSEIARQLGAQPHYLDLDLNTLPEELEAWCWATGQLSPELVFRSMLEEAEGQDVPTIFFAGHNGDGLWEVNLGEPYLTRQVVRGAQSGYALIEARVRYGVVECSTPYIFSRSAPEVNRISKSQELAPWRLDNAYDRPIPRRMLEERGVPRDAFGWGKKAVAQDFESPQGTALRARFFDASLWNPFTESAYRSVNFGIYFAGRGVDFVRTRGDRGKMVWSAGRTAKRTLAQVADLQRHTFAVCADWLASRYG